MRYKQYRLEKWCKVAKIAMIEKDISLFDLMDGTGLSRSYAINVLNGQIKSQQARDKISDFLKIKNYYADD